MDLCTLSPVTRHWFQSLWIHLGLLAGAMIVWWGNRAFEVGEAISYVELRERAAKVSDTAKTSKAVVKSSETTVSNTSSQAPASSESSASSGVSGGEAVRGSYEVAELPVLLKEKRVPYPPEARAKNVSGDVTAEIIISSSGRVIQVTILQSPDEILSNAAREALSSFEFKPAMMEGKAVSVKIKYRYRFVLE
jgi:TonB family protein